MTTEQSQRQYQDNEENVYIEGRKVRKRSTIPTVTKAGALIQKRQFMRHRAMEQQRNQLAKATQNDELPFLVFT